MPRPIDALICGGGVTGLWLRAVLQDYGRSVVLIESQSLGSGQTIASQGILHSGAKYSTRADQFGELLSVLPTMAHAWQQHLAGENLPDLRGTQIITQQTWYWSHDRRLPDALRSWLPSQPDGDETATAPRVLGDPVTAWCNRRESSVAPASLLAALAGDQRGDLLHVPQGHLGWDRDDSGQVTLVRLTHPQTGQRLELQPRFVYLAAGANNAALRESLGLAGEAVMQRRPLQMGLLRGRLPTFCGHWFDEAGPRLTISTQFDSSGRTVWQLGGRLAEPPHDESPVSFLQRARREVTAGLPGLDLSGMEWSCYEAVRAEPKSTDGRMPQDGEILKEGNVLTLWPTKLTLLPLQMIDIRRGLDRGGVSPQAALNLPSWPQPAIAEPPWETTTSWFPEERVATWQDRRVVSGLRTE